MSLVELLDLATSAFRRRASEPAPGARGDERDPWDDPSGTGVGPWHALGTEVEAPVEAPAEAPAEIAPIDPALDAWDEDTIDETPEALEGSAPRAIPDRRRS